MNKKYVFVVISHLEVEPDNFSTEVVKAFGSLDKAQDFASRLEWQASDNETIVVEELVLE